MKLKTNTYVLKISYDGTNYYGWQIQNNSDLRTIQGELERALKKINSDGFLSSLGASRTDKGVHAIAQICRVELSYEIKCSGLKKALNDLLPKDIRVIDILKSDSNFHPLRDILEKEYEYRFTHETVSIFLNRYVTKIHDTVDLRKMKQACKLFIGEYDFQNFHCVGSEPTSTRRKIISCSIEKETIKDFSDEFSVYCFKIRGNGFLKQMVRLLVGAVINVGSGKLKIEDLEQALLKKIEHKLSVVTPPEGLSLSDVKMLQSVSSSS